MIHKKLNDKGFGGHKTYSIILPIDQGVEHGPYEAFLNTDHPEMLDIEYQCEYINELLAENLISGAALPFRTAKRFAEKYYDQRNKIIVKMNHSNNINPYLDPDQTVYAPGDIALTFGGCGYTIYPGSENNKAMSQYYIQLDAHIRNNIPNQSYKKFIWSYPRGAKINNEKPFDETSLSTIMHAAYIAAQLNPNVIKVKIPTNISGPTDLKHVVNAACGIPVIFSGGSHKNASSVLQDAKCVAEAGGLGMIVGRNVFQRKPAEAKELLKEIHAIFADT